MWAFAQMAFARPLLRGVPGLRFVKLMGAGRGRGFTLLPDPGRYALLAVWGCEADARAFLQDSRFMRRYRRHAMHDGTALLETLAAHGSWNGGNPFLPALSNDRRDEGRVAVLTRATIRLSRLRAFWRRVGPVSRALEEVDGLECSIGIGEAPFVRQATLSIWRDRASMEGFAYRSDPHRDVVQRTRREGWYREDLFARFQVMDIVGRFL